MATTSTLPAVKAQLVSRLTTLLATTGVGGTQIPVTYAWPGTDTRSEAVFLGRHPGLGGDPFGRSTSIRSELANIVAGRKQRNETYELELTIWSFQPQLVATDAATAEARGFVILAVLENLLADTPLIGLTSIKSAELTDVDVVGGAPIPWEKGYVSLLVPTVTITARLT